MDAAETSADVANVCRACCSQAASHMIARAGKGLGFHLWQAADHPTSLIPAGLRGAG